MKRLPTLTRLHERHRALPPEVCACYAQAAAVCLSRHHVPPTTVMELTHPKGIDACEAWWEQPDDRALDAWNNADDATRDGAYGVAIAAVELTEGMVACSRAETRTGADYYVVPKKADPLDLESLHRLEISGVDRGDAKVVARRVEEKLLQTVSADVDGPALACVVGFRARSIVVAQLA